MADLFDLIVIGGGCNGTGVARDAAMRGLSVLLLEKEDFGSKTTGASSGMIHGGPRYLLAERGTTKLSCKDSGYIRKAAPHLCFRIPFIVPILNDDYPGIRGKIQLELVETFFEVYDKYTHLKGGKNHTRLSPAEVHQVEPSIPSEIAGAVTFDEWGIDAFRLCAVNAVAAAKCGADVRNHTEVTSIIRESNQVIGVKLRDLITGRADAIGGKVVFNAGGPFASALAAMAGIKINLRPAKGIHLIFDRRLTNMAITARGIDGRQIFINPHENKTLVGTTDDDYYGDLDDIPVTEDEIEYLLQGIESVFPEIRKCRIVTTWRGVRPTLYGQNIYEDNLSRAHEVIDHEKKDGVAGFVSMVGGKLASYREMAEEGVNLVCKKLGVKAKCKTRVAPLPGGDYTPGVNEAASQYGIDHYAAYRMIAHHGSEVKEILKDADEFEKRTHLCSSEPVTEAQVKYVIRKEMAKTVSDISRRTQVGTAACQGGCCAVPVTAVLAKERNLTSEDAMKSLVNFLNEGWKARAPILDGAQLAQEEINQSIFKGMLPLTPTLSPKGEGVTKKGPSPLGERIKVRGG